MSKKKLYILFGFIFLVITSLFLGNSIFFKGQITKRFVKTVKYDFTARFLCNDEIISEENFGREFTTDYCTHIRNANNLKIYFAYDHGNLVIYTVRANEGRNILIDYQFFASLPIYYVPRDIYSHGEQIEVISFNEAGVTFRIVDNCLEDYEYCNFSSEDLSGYYYVEDGNFKNYYDNNLFDTEDLRNRYIRRALELDNESISFLKELLGIFPPIDKFIQINTLSPDEPGISYASGFWIVNRNQDPVTTERIDSWEYGNTHEFVHAYLYGIPVIRSWFEEGLADYAYHRQNDDNSLYCREDGWERGSYDIDGNFVRNSPLVEYSNFSVPPSSGVDFYSPLNRSSYYRSAECLWNYIEENFGVDSIKQTVQVWNGSRKILPPIEKKLIRDIINPTLHTDLSELVRERYNYSEE